MDWWSFRIPLVRRFTTAKHRLQHRQGLILRITSRDGVVGFGEASPLPSHGADVADAHRALLSLTPSRLEHALAGGAIDLGDDTPPHVASALRAAFETATLDLSCRRQGTSFGVALSRQHHRIAPARRVPVNATVFEPETVDAVATAVAAIRDGVTCVKLKVGMCQKPGDEYARAAAVRAAIGPHAALRLDANATWSVDEAIETLALCRALGIDYVEQPVAATDLAGMKRVQNETGISVGADEAITSVTAAHRVLEAEAADVLIVKHMVVGGLTSALEIVQLADHARARTVMTTTIDAGIATAAVAHLASLLTPPVPPCGLATTTFLQDDLLAGALNVVDGHLDVPIGPGSGVEVNMDALAKYAGPWSGSVVASMTDR